MTQVYELEEVRAAAKALRDGQFKQAAKQTWSLSPATPMVLVLGAEGGSGSTAVALAIAEATTAARLIECCAQGDSGLVAAGLAELGETSGWLRADRDAVRLDRRADNNPFAVPTPLASSGDETVVVDAGHDLDVVGQTPWLRELLERADVILVCRATIPGLRRLEAKLAALDALGRPVAAALVIGPARKRWPKDLGSTLGRLTRGMDADGGLLTVAHDPSLAYHGIDTSPLPSDLQRAGEQIARQLQLPMNPRK